MAKLLLNLRHVPDDEADAVRALLEGERIRYYETPPGNWGISAGGIWLQEDHEYPRARACLDEYQRRRQELARAAHAEAVRKGEADRFVDVVRREPLRVVLVFAAILLILVLMGLPAYLLMR